MDYNVQDMVNTSFGQVEYDFKQPKGVPNWIVGANVIGQQSIGSNLLTGAPFETYQASAKAQMVYAGFTVFAAGSITGDKSNIFSPYGTKPNYTDMQEISFDNAGEKAIGGSVAYDFGISVLRTEYRRLVYARMGRHRPQHQYGNPRSETRWTFGYNTVPRKVH